MAQVLCLAKNLDCLNIDLLIASNVRRAQQTAEIIAKHRSMPFTTSHLFNEWLMPKCIFGKSACDYPERYIRFRTARLLDRYAKYDDGESLFEVISRVKESKRYLSGLTCESVVVISHFNFIKFFAIDEMLPSEWSATALLKTASDLDLAHTSMCLFHHDKHKNEFQCEFWNQQSERLDRHV
jgi:broad specificity phosphatase PhoE